MARGPAAGPGDERRELYPAVAERLGAGRVAGIELIEEHAAVRPDPQRPNHSSVSRRPSSTETRGWKPSSRSAAEMSAYRPEPLPCEPIIIDAAVVSAPDVTVVVPAWGPYGGAPLRQAVASLRGQDLAARIVVVDNNSEEPLPPPPRLDGVVYVRAPRRQTVGAARNLGLERVDTRYVLFWDADDLMLPGTLRFLHERIASDPRVVAVASAILDDEPRVRHRWPPRAAAPLARRPALFAICHAVLAPLARGAREALRR